MNKMLFAIFLMIPFVNFAQIDFVRTVDKFTGEIKITTPYSGLINYQPIKVIKYIRDKQISYYLYLKAYGHTLNVGEKGVTILFTDGMKWEKPYQEIDVDASEQGWIYTAFIPITEEDLDFFASKYIEAFRLYIYDSAPINKKKRERVYPEWFRLIKDMK